MNTTAPAEAGSSLKRFLHVGCGPKDKRQTTPGFATGPWQEIRFDIDPRARPDIVGTMTDMGAVPDASVDAVFSSHNIEHLYPHEVPVALAEFRRVLRDDGFVVITCPDLQSVCALIAQDKLLEPAYTSPSGAISPLDILYGHRPAMAKGNLFMAHRTGFTRSALRVALLEAGFRGTALLQLARRFELWAVATKSEMPEADLKELVRTHFPGGAGLTPAS